jgi:hypothetical protein
MDDVENDLRQMGVRRWRTKVVDRDEWRMLTEEAWVLAGTVAPRSKLVSKYYTILYSNSNSNSNYYNNNYPQ